MQQADVAHVLNQGTYRSGVFLRKTYLSLLSVWTLPSLLIISIPLQTLPNMVCFPGQYGYISSALRAHEKKFQCIRQRKEQPCLPFSILNTH